MSSSLPSLRNILFICILQLMEFWFNVVGIILEDSASLICRDDKYYIETKVKVGLLLFGCEIIISCPFTISEVSCGVQWKPRRTLLHDLFPDVYKASYACCQSPSRCQPTSRQCHRVSQQADEKNKMKNLQISSNPNSNTFSIIRTLPP